MIRVGLQRFVSSIKLPVVVEEDANRNVKKLVEVEGVVSNSADRQGIVPEVSQRRDNVDRLRALKKQPVESTTSATAWRR